MNFIFVISSLLQCLTNQQKQRFYLQLDEQLGINCPACSVCKLLPPFPPFICSCTAFTESQKGKVLGTEQSLRFFSILLQFRLAKNSSCLSHSNLDSLSELLLQKYTGHLIQLIFFNCPKQHFSLQFSIA